MPPPLIPFTQDTIVSALQKTLLAQTPPDNLHLEPDTRLQCMAYELFANNGYFDKLSPTAFGDDPLDIPHPLWWTAIPPDMRYLVNLNGVADEPCYQHIATQLLREINLPNGNQVKVTLIPVHWEQVPLLKKQHPDIFLFPDGTVYRTSSPRTVIFGPTPESLPKATKGLEGYAVKLHWPPSSEPLDGGLGGHRFVTLNDAKQATWVSCVLEELRPFLSPYFDFLPEPVSIALKIQGAAPACEFGGIFRQIAPNMVPGFSLYSPTELSLPHVQTAIDTSHSLLAEQAVRFAMQKHPELSFVQGVLTLFVNPLLDVTFSLASQGFMHETHPQNFSLKFNQQTGLVDKVVLKDLHGMNYNAAYRLARGFSDIFALEHLKKKFPDLTQQDLDTWFIEKDNTLYKRFQLPEMHRITLDFFISIYFFQLLHGLFETKALNRKQVDALIKSIQQAIAKFAQQYKVDLSTLPSRQGVFWKTVNICDTVLFR